jgi:hypothetical protein
MVPDFVRSRLCWKVRSGGSLGFFALDSFLRLHQAKEVPKEFVLTAMVLAGNLYSTNSLVKHPPYFYQMIAGDGAYQILRTATPDQTPQPFNGTGFDDSIGNSNELFHFLDLEIEATPSDQIRRIDLSDARNVPKGPLVGCVALQRENSSIEVFFPIRHWNRLGSRPDFQVETGPVLWPRFVSDFYGGREIHHLQPAFLHFGTEKLVEVSLDYPYFRRLDREKQRSETHACQIHIYEIVS